jgi:hypothetical protein
VYPHVKRNFVNKVANRNKVALKRKKMSLGIELLLCHSKKRKTLKDIEFT